MAPADPADPADPAAAEPAAAHAEQLGYRPHQQLVPLGAEQAWQHSTGAGVTVAVIDSGVDADHPDLAGRVLPGADFVDGSTDGRTDVVGHGTTVASLVAGQGGDQATGLAPAAEILPVRVLDEENRYETAATVADGVRWAIRQGADVINLSLGGNRHSAALSEAVAAAMASDVVVIACTGNVDDDPRARVWYPAREPGIVAVAGLTPDGESLTSWPDSLTGPETVLAAPAVVEGAAAGGGYRRVQGTSFSSALVAGTAALIRARWPDLPAGDVVNRLVATADDLGEPGRDPLYGFGVLDPSAALTEEVPPAPTNPLDTTARHGMSGLGAAPHLPRPSDLTAPTPEPVPSRAVAVELFPGEPAGDTADATATAAGAGSGGGPGPVVWWTAALLGSVLLLLVTTAFRGKFRLVPTTSQPPDRPTATFPGARSGIRPLSED